MKAAAESFAFQQERQRKANDEMVDLWKSSGIKIHMLSDDEKKAWSELAGHKLPAFDALKDRYGRGLYEKLASMSA